MSNELELALEVSNDIVRLTKMIERLDLNSKTEYTVYRLLHRHIEDLKDSVRVHCENDKKLKRKLTTKLYLVK